MNIQGFGGISKQKALGSLFFDLNPDMILLQETMCNFTQSLLMFSKFKPGWEFCALDAYGLFGGLLAGWNPLLVRCKDFSSIVGIVLKASIKGISKIFSIITTMGLMHIELFFGITFWPVVYLLYQKFSSLVI